MTVHSRSYRQVGCDNRMCTIPHTRGEHCTRSGFSSLYRKIQVQTPGGAVLTSVAVHSAGCGISSI